MDRIMAKNNQYADVKWNLTWLLQIRASSLLYIKYSLTAAEKTTDLLCSFNSEYFFNQPFPLIFSFHSAETSSFTDFFLYLPNST